MITGIELLDKELNPEFQQNLNSDYSFVRFVMSVLKLPIIFNKEYEFSITYDFLGEEEADFINRIYKYIFNIGFYTSVPEEMSDNKFLFIIKPTDRGLTREEWDLDKYKNLLLQNKIKDFNIDIQGDHDLLIYCRLLLQSLLKSFPDKVVPEILSILFSTVDNLLNHNQELIITVGDFEEVDLATEDDPNPIPRYGLHEYVTQTFSDLFEEGNLFDYQQSSMKYENKKVILHLIPKITGEA